MKKKWLWPLVLTLCLVFPSPRAGLAEADDLLDPVLQQAAHLVDGDIYETDLSALGFAEQTILRGPYQAVSSQFTLPYAWDLKDDVLLELQVNSTFQSLMEAFTEADLSEVIADRFGILRVAVNGETAAEVRLTNSGEETIQVALGADLFARDAQPNTLTLSWDASDACQQSITTQISISGASRVAFSAQEVPVSPSLRHFPAPFFTPYALVVDPVALILPPQPDAEMVSALMAAAAGFGRQTNGEGRFTVYTADAVPAPVLEGHQLVFIGKDGDLDAAFRNTGITIGRPSFTSSANENAGLLSVLPSPWNERRAMLIISGRDGIALRKAAAVLAADEFFTTANGSQAVISEVSDVLAGQQWQIDRTFSELFEREEITVNTLGTVEIHLPFNAPADMALSPEAYLELYFRHSQLINYLQSSVSVTLNDKAIGTIRFGDQTATNGLARIILPPNSVRPLRNDLTLTFTVSAQDLCADERSGNFWITVFGDSYLHLPPMLQSAPLAERVFLANLRNTFFRSASYSDIEFILPADDSASLQSAADLAARLGSLTLSSIMLPEVQFLGTDWGADGDKGYFIFAESVSVSNLESLNTLLPLTFDAGGNLQQVEADGIAFTPEEGQSFGVLQLVERGDGKRTALLIAGNNPTGIGLALDSLQEKLANPGRARANVEILQTSGDTHSFLIVFPEVAQPDGPLQTSGGLAAIFADSHSNRLALLLLAAVVPITLVYVLWLARRKRE